MLTAVAVATATAAVATGPTLAGAATGDLAYEGCITAETQSGPTPGSAACDAIAKAQSSGTSSGLNLPSGAALSADGTSLYLVAAADDSVARFNRNPATGDLAYKGCISGDSSTGPSGT